MRNTEVPEPEHQSKDLKQMLKIIIWFFFFFGMKFFDVAYQKYLLSINLKGLKTRYILGKLSRLKKTWITIHTLFKVIRISSLFLKARFYARWKWSNISPKNVNHGVIPSNTEM